MRAKSVKHERETHARHSRVPHPHSVPTLAPEEFEREAGITDLEPEVRYRMVSEGAYHRYVDRGCEEGYELEDWLAAEADVDGQLADAAKHSEKFEGE